MTRVWIAALALTLALTGCQKPPELIDIGQVPEFAFVDQNGQAVGTAQLAGKPWVANFLFTSCPSSCPPLAKATAGLQTRIKGWADGPDYPVALVSITVDPVTDTPERLTEFGQKYDADPAIWKFARGEYDAMELLVTDGFMMPILRKDMVEAPDDDALAQARSRPTPLETAHSVKFVLVDGQGHIRGLYSMEEKDLDELSRALRHLVEEASKGS